MIKTVKNEMFLMMRTTGDTKTSAVLLRDIYKDGAEYVIGSYPDETAFIVFKALKNTFNQIEHWEKKEPGELF